MQVWPILFTVYALFLSSSSYYYLLIIIGKKKKIDKIEYHSIRLLLLVLWCVSGGLASVLIGKTDLRTIVLFDILRQ